MDAAIQSLPDVPGDLPVASLPTISYRSLVSGDADEANKLLSVSIREGFFYLDLSDEDASDPTLNHIDQVYQFMNRWFNQPIETKLEELQSDYTDGYKAPGYFAGPYEGTRDAYESLKVSHKTLRAQTPVSPWIKSQGDLFKTYLGRANDIARQLLGSLSTAMSIPSGEGFETFHQTSEDSNSVLVLLRYPYVPPDQQSKTVGHNKHTDIGSITVLFTDQWGLQVMAADSQQWEFVAPRPGCAIINVGDTLRFLSKKKLRSCLHRVVPVEGQTSDRYTIAYFLRPDNGVSFTDSNGSTVTAENWHDRKYEVFRATHEEQRQDTILTGGLEPVAVGGGN